MRSPRCWNHRHQHDRALPCATKFQCHVLCMMWCQLTHLAVAAAALLLRGCLCARAADLPGRAGGEQHGGGGGADAVACGAHVRDGGHGDQALHHLAGVSVCVCVFWGGGGAGGDGLGDGLGPLGGMG